MFKNCILYNLYFYRFGMHWSALYIFFKIKSYHADLRAEIVLFIEVPAVVYAGFPADSKILRKQLQGISWEPKSLTKSTGNSIGKSRVSSSAGSHCIFSKKLVSPRLTR